MYLTAHRVESPNRAKRGINATLYLHDSPEDRSLDWSHPNVAEISEARPGRFVAEDNELKPGGNTVASYLDIIAPDGTADDLICESLSQFEPSIGSAALPITAQFGPIVIRFYARYGLQGNRVDVFGALRKKAVDLLHTKTRK